MLNVLLFYSTYIAGFVGSLGRNPIFAFALYEAVYFFYPDQRWWGHMVPNISYSFFVVLLMMFLVVIKFKETQENKLLKVPLIRWLYLFLGLFWVASFYAVLPAIHHEAAVFFLKTVIIISLAFKLCSHRKQLNYIIFGYIFGAWYVSFLTFQVGRNAGDRVEGIGMIDSPDSNDVAAAIAPALVLCLYYFWTAKNWQLRLVAAVAGVFIANGLVLINSRGGFLAAAIGITFFMWHLYFSKVKRKYQKTSATALIIVGLVGGISLMDDSFIQRMYTMQNTEVDAEQESGATRTIFWMAALDMAQDHPFGGGYKAFNYYAPYYIPQDVNTGNSKHRTVHSTWFEALSEVGYLGLIVFILMIGSAFFALNKCKKQFQATGDFNEFYKMIALQAALLSYLVAATFLNRMRAEILYWLILYAACAYNIYILKKDAVPDNHVKLDRKSHRRGLD